MVILFLTCIVFIKQNIIIIIVIHEVNIGNYLGMILFLKVCQSVLCYYWYICMYFYFLSLIFQEH